MEKPEWGVHRRSISILGFMLEFWSKV
ncbi:hypothetical protein NPIL_542561, partial [Nephila pilipes]